MLRKTRSVRGGGHFLILAEVRYRRGVAADLRAMWELDVVCFEETFRFSLRAMRQFASAANATVWVAEAGMELVGFAIVEAEGDAGYLVTLDVAPAWRRGGVARALIGLAEQGLRAVGLHVFAGNEGAVRFYEGLGFRRLEVERGFYGAGLDALVYGREVDREELIAER